MPYENISAEISDADMQVIRAAVATLKTKLPFLVTLSAAERKSLLKMGERSVGFVRDSLAAAEGHAQILPGTFSIPEFRKDVALSAQLDTISALLAEVMSGVDDTAKAVGSEAMTKASQVYRLVKEAAKTEPCLKPVAAQLAVRFASVGPKAKPKTP